jgi:hypothetical protein
MKFKSIFFLFNIVVVFSFSLIFLLPMILLSGSYSSLFWLDNWYLAFIFFILIALLDSYFILNWKLFTYLENEDWNNLTQYLEEKIYIKAQFRKQYIRLMINTSLAVSNLDKIDRLAKEISDRKPALLPRYALLLGIPLFLRDDTGEALVHYGKFKDIKETVDINWVKWVYAFSLIRENNKDMAVDILLEIIGNKIDDVLMLIALYSLDSIAFSSDTFNRLLNEHLEKYREEKKWNNYLETQRTKNIFILLLTGILDEARKWERNSTPDELSV